MQKYIPRNDDLSREKAFVRKGLRLHFLKKSSMINHTNHTLRKELNDGVSGR